MKTKKLYSLTSYPGLKYFRNSFMMHGSAFFILFAATLINMTVTLNTSLEICMKFFFEYTLSMGGFLLVYSLIWKSLRKYMFKRMAALNIMAILISFIDVFRMDSNALFITQIALSAYGLMISYSNYKKNKKGFSQFYLIIMILNIIGWISNLSTGVFIAHVAELKYYNYAITLAIFIIFFVGTVIFSRQKHYIK